MPRTDFRPSIHGWPFTNWFEVTLGLFDTPWGPLFDLSTHMGFCGGMCWTALRRYYAGASIAREPVTTPVSGDPLYVEIAAVQVQSLPISTLMRIADWQESPDMGHMWNPHHSLGHRTQQQWSGVRSLLDAGRPVTLTLIASSNDYNPVDLKNNHRVVAFAYEERGLYPTDWVHGDRNDNIRKILIRIYDPNHPNDDDVFLTFFTGCDDSWIGLFHNRGDSFHGFFLDDEARAYAYGFPTTLAIVACTQTEIVSAGWAHYDLTFGWRCKVIPYFTIEIDGTRWSSNPGAGAAFQEAFDDIAPTNSDTKQCPSVAGSQTVKLRLPRRCTRVSVRLMDSDEFVQTIEVDATPSIQCFPYVHTARTERDPGIIWDRIEDADLFIADEAPSEVAVEQLDTSPFRWIESRYLVRVQDHRDSHSDLTRAIVQVLDRTRIGNVVVPVLASIVESNLAPPTRTSGTVSTVRGEVTTQTANLPTLSSTAQPIFAGFSDPADYDNDTRVEFAFQSVDRFGVAVQGRATFYARSLIHDETTLEVNVFDPSKVAMLEMRARKLIELGLLSTVIELPDEPPGVIVGPPNVPVAPGIGPHPPRRPHVDPDAFVKKLRANRVIQAEIGAAQKATWNSVKAWQSVWKHQSELLKSPLQVDDSRTVSLKEIGGRYAFNQDVKHALQQELDGIVLQTLTDAAVDGLCKQPGFLDKLKRL
jgi:hypothetical protein